MTGTPARADVGTCVLAYVANDGFANSLSYTSTITVNNIMPVVNAVNTTLAEDSAATIINTAAQVTSSDEGYGTYSIGTPLSNNCTPARGVVSIDATTGELTFAPNVNFDTNCNIRVQFNDGKPLNNIGYKDITVTMIPSPDNAVVSLPAACNVSQNEDILYNCIPTKVDPDTGDTHNWSIDANTCSWVTQSAVLTGVMTGTPNDNHVGTCTFTIKATGNQDGLVTSTLVANITVNNVQPVLSGTNPVNILMNAAAANIQNIVSTDENYGTYSLIPATSIPCEDQKAQPITIDPTTGVINYMPLAKFAGPCKINVRFDDENALNNIREYEFTVNVQDFIKPYIEYIDSPDDNTPTYQLGSIINIDVKFDEQIVINTTLGTPRLFLETGAIDRFAEYDSRIGANLDTLRFKYTVQQGDLSTDLKVHATVSTLDLRDSVIADRFNNFETVYVTPVSGPNSLHEREDLKVNGSVSIPTVTGLPTRVSPDVALNATVGGTDIISYRYKVTDITSPTDACTNATGYSGATIPIATLITDSLFAVPSGTTMRICVVGTNSLSIETPLANAFTYVWTKDLFSVAKVSFASVTNLANWQDSEVDPDNNNIIYAKNLLGEVYKSTDFGANWQLYCLVSQTYNGQIEVSPGPDRTPYVFQNGRAYKVINAAGGACTDLYALGGFSQPVATDYNIKNYDFTANGDLYIGFINGANFEIHRSFNQGTNWTLFATTSTSGTTAISFAIHPNIPNTISYSMYKSTPGAGPGVYISYDAGITKNIVAGVFQGGYSNFKWDLYDTTYVFSGVGANSHKSIDSAATWIADNTVGYASPGLFSSTSYFVRWDIDKITGHAYKMITNGTHSYLQKATNLYSGSATVWNTIYTFSNIGGYYDVGLSVSVSGNAAVPASPTITVNIKNQMFVSTDGGATFNEQYAVKELKLASISSFGDGAIYGATYDWAVVKTTDNGKNWLYKQFDYSQCLSIPPRIMVNREDNDKVLTWSENYTASNCSNFNYSVDGMNTQISRDAFSITAPALQVSMSINDPRNFYITGKPTGSFKANTTENNAYENLQTTLTGLEFSSPMPDSYISPVDKNKIWIIDNIVNGVFYEYNILTRTRSQITTSGLTSIAAIDSFIGLNGQYGIRLIDRVGRLQVSYDFGLTFLDEGAASGVLTSCNKRFLYHHPKDSTLLLTACLSTDLIAYSKDNGLTWTQINTLTKFSINCNIKGLALSSSKIFLACKNSDTYEFNYTSVENINVINDNILTVAEQLPATDLVNHLYPGTYSTIEYKVIFANDLCDGSTGYSLTVPQSNDPVFTTRGGYRVCIKQLDGSGATTYTTSSVIFYDNTSPTFTSIALIGDASDGKITYIESFNQTPIVGTLVSSDHDFVKYAVTASGNVCNGSLTYTYLTPQSQNDSLKLAGNYKVCVQLTTKGNLSPVYGASAAFDFDPTTVIANITNTPVDFISTETALDVIITGTNITKYKYKIVGTTTSCKDSTSYSVEVPVGTKITSDLTGYLNGTHLKLCVIGSDNLDNWQSYEKATEFYWIHSKSLIATRLDLSGVNSLSAWRNVAVHQASPNIMYAINDMGEIFRTDNAGTNWQIMCRVNTYLNHMNFKLSPGDDATAYVSANYTDNNDIIIASLIYRVDSRNGEYCPSVVGDFRGTAEVNFYHSSLAIDNKGILYFAETQYNSIVLRRSLDFGKSWQFVGQLFSKGTRAAVFIHPTNSNYMLISTIVNNGSAGLSQSTDGGKTWALVNTSASFTDVADIYFDPINPGRVYTNNGMFSTDYGATWAYTASLNVGTNRRWFVDSSGAGYQSTIFGGTSTRLQKSASLNPPAFVDVASFATVGSDLHATVSAAGSNIAIIANKQLHISVDSGATFTQIFWPGKHTRLSGIDSANGQKQYAVTTAMKVFRSDNNGEAWTCKTQYYDQYCHRNTGNNPNYNRVMAHPIFPDTAFVFGAGCLTNTISTSDGFDNSVLMGRGVRSYSAFSMAPYATSNIKAEYLLPTFDIQGGISILSNDLFNTENNVTFSRRESLVSVNSTPYGISYLGNEDITMQISNNQLYEIRRNEKITANITGKLTFATPAAIRLTTDQNNLAYKYVIISSTGQLNHSKDNGITYQAFGSSPGLTTCPSRILATYPNDSNIMATICYGGNDIAWTQDNGATWQQYTLWTTYGMSCGLAGITIDHSKISFSCIYSYDGLFLNHNPVNLVNGASDNILLSGDADGNLVSIYNAAKYITIDYSLIAEGATCNAGNTYSAVIPRKSDLLVNGNYQVCTKLFDGTTTRYVKSSVIHYSAVSPIFTSIDLVSASGVHLKDIVATPASLVNNLIGSNYSNSYYALVDSATTCNDSITYSEVIPRTDSPLFINPGIYKVCVALTNQAGQKVYGASSDFSYSKDTVYAKINNAPEGISSETILNTTISGTLLDNYKYKIGESASIDCKVSSGYSASTPAATPITDDISGLANGLVKLCVLGLNNDGKNQVAAQPTVHTWTKNTFNLATQNLNVKTKVNEWHDIVVSKNSPSRIYGSTTRGRVFLSNDRGVSWEFQCQVPYDTTSRIITSNSTTPLAFISSGGEIYRIEHSPMPAICPSITSAIGTLVTSLKRVPLVITNKNELYLVEELNSTTSYLRYSYDNGETWSLRQTLSSFGPSVNLFMDPVFNNNIHFSFEVSGNAYRTTENYGLSIESNLFTEFLQTPTGTLAFLWAPGVELKFDPSTPGRIFTNNNLYTINNGEIWLNSNNFADNLIRWDIANDGTAYRLKQNGANVDVETATSASSASTTVYKTITGVTLDTKEAISISGDQATIAIIIANKAFISLDAANFVQIDSPDTTHYLASLASENSSTLYGVDYNWNYYKSADGGVSNLYMATYNTPCVLSPRIKTNKSDSNFVYSYAYEATTNTGCTQNMFSTDGLATSTAINTSLASPAPVVALNQANSTQLAIYGNSSVARSTNSAATFTTFTLPNVTALLQNPDGAMSTVDPAFSWTIPVADKLYEHDTTLLSRTDITNKLTFATPSGVESLSNGSILVISRTGALNVSVNDALNFTSLSAVAPLQNCQRRLLRTLSSDTNIKASACFRSSYVSYTKNAGVNWTEINLASYVLSSACTINDVAIVSQGAKKKIAIACSGRESLLFTID